MTRSTSAMVSRSAGRRMGMPALLTMTSSGPSSSQIRRPGRPPRPGRTGRRPTPASGAQSSRQSPATSSSRSARRATRATVVPRSASSRAVAAPMPDEAPVTRAVVPDAVMAAVRRRRTIRGRGQRHLSRCRRASRSSAEVRRSQPGGGGSSRQYCSGTLASRRSESRWSCSSGADLAGVVARWPCAWPPCPVGRARRPGWATGRCGRAWRPARPAGPGGACSRRPRSRTTAAPPPVLARWPLGPAARRRGSARGPDWPGPWAGTPRVGRRRGRWPRPRAGATSAGVGRWSAARYWWSGKSSHTGVAPIEAMAARSSSCRDADHVVAGPEAAGRVPRRSPRRDRRAGARPGR